MNDGQTHDVVVGRTGGVLSILIDGNPSGAIAAATPLAALAPLMTGTDVCVGVDSTQPLSGTVTDVCLTRD